MKKTTFLKTIFLLTVLLVGSINVWADKITITGADMTGTDGAQAITKSGIGFNGFLKQYNSTKIWFTSGTGYIYNTVSLGSITKITLSYNTGGSSSAIQRFNVGSTAMSSYMTAGGTTVSTSTGGSTYDFIGGVGNGFFNLSVSNKNLQLVSLEIEYTLAASCTPSNLAFANPTVDKLMTDAPFTITATSDNATTAISYSSTNEAVAIVNPTSGEVTIVSAGSTIISATQLAGTHNSTDYCATVATYNLEVASTLPTITITDITELEMQTNVGDTDSETMQVNATKLTNNIILSITGTDAAMFSVTPTPITPTSGTVSNVDITINYVPTEAGSHTATLNIASVGAETVTRSLSGSSTWAPLAKPTLTGATNISNTALTLNWDAVSGATDYLVNVYTKEGGSANATDLFISEYVEGSGYNKVIEIYNGTGTSIDLSKYSLKKQTNGDGIYASELILSGTLLNNNVFVISHNHDDVDALIKAAADLTNNTAINFNGNDAVALFKNGVKIDEVGVSGQLADWGKDLTLIRKSSVLSPKDTYDEADWNIEAQNYFDNIGIHTMEGGSSATPFAGSPFTVSTNSKELTGLSAATNYYYTVTAQNANVSSLTSDEYLVSTLQTSVYSPSGKLQLRIINGQAVFEASANQSFEVYNAVGQKLVSTRTSEGLNKLSINAKGLVIIKIDNEIVKVTL
jgi:hypothetical protein